MAKVHEIPGWDTGANGALVYNPSISPLRVSAQDHFIGGREWARVNPEDVIVADHIANNRLRLLEIISLAQAEPSPEETSTPKPKRGRKPKSATT